MTEPIRCPVCITGPELRRLNLHANPVPLRRCDVCLGLLADQDTVTLAVRHYHEKHYVMAEGHGRHRCRACRVLFDGARGACPACLEAQSIECPRCKNLMAVVHVVKVALDVCKPCRIVWFDRGELGLLVRRHRGELEARLSSLPALAVSELGTNVAVNPVSALDGVSLTVDAAPYLLEGAGHAAVAVSEVAVETSGAAVDVLLDVVAGIFS